MSQPGQPLPPCPHCGAAHSDDLLVCPATNQILPLEGRMLDKRFRLIRMLGEGGMSTVWMAENVRVRKHVAIKLMHPEYARNPRTLHRFQNEATAAGRIGSPHICDILDFGECPLGPYMVMEMLRGQSFAEFLESQGKIDPPLAVLIIREALKGLAAAHAVGIIHRDLKPENLFLHEPEPGRMLVKLMDFGISKFSEDTGGGKTGANVIMGTPEYMSPEQAAGAANVDGRTDIWAMGVMLYRALAGTEPFKGKTMAALLVALSTENPAPLASFEPNLPPGLIAIVDRCLHKRPEDRFATTQELCDALAPYEQRVSAGERPPAPPVQSGKTMAIAIDPLTLSGLAAAGMSPPTPVPSLSGEGTPPAMTIITGPPPSVVAAHQAAQPPMGLANSPTSAGQREGQTWSAEIRPPAGTGEESWTTSLRTFSDEQARPHQPTKSRGWLGWLVGVTVVGLLAGGGVFAWQLGVFDGKSKGGGAVAVADEADEEATEAGEGSTSAEGSSTDTGSTTESGGTESGGTESGEPATSESSGDEGTTQAAGESGEDGGSTSTTGGGSSTGGSGSGGSSSGGSSSGGSSGGSGGDDGDDGNDTGGSSGPQIQLAKLFRVGSLYTPKDKSPTGTHGQAKSHCASLKKQKKYGLEKWRLPTSAEVMSFKASIDKTLYWTSESEGTTAKAINVLNGRTVSKPQSDNARAMCVSKR